MLNTSVAPWPSFSEEEVEAVARVLRSNRVNQWTGEEVWAFEREFARFSATNHAVAVANGTLALDLALKALNIGEGSEVIVTPRTFIASVSSVVNAGATPVFADVDRDSGNISPETIAAVMSARTKAVIPVHLAGWPCDMEGILALAKPGNVALIEDCAQAHGARIGGKSVGSFGDVGAWSFCQDKIMTTGGEGGMVTVNDDDLWRSMWSYKDHGKDWDAVFNREHPPGFRWLHEHFGTNWRMLEMQAAIGRIQLQRMDDWHARRAQISKQLAETLAPFADAVRVPLPATEFEHAWYRFYAYIRPEGLKADWSRDRIVEEVTARNVPLFHGSCPEVYREKAFESSRFTPAQRLPIAMELGATSLMFLTHPTLTNDDLERIIMAVTEVMKCAAR